MKKYLFILFLFFTTVFACTGDCVSCHKVLDYTNDLRHSPMTTCITCHTTDSVKNVNMGSACGVDCFQCHKVEKITQSDVTEHKLINDCIKCHQTLKKDVFVSQKNNLKDMILLK